VVNCSVAGPPMLWPISETAIRLPQVAAVAPTSHAPIVRNTRESTEARVAERSLRSGQASIKTRATGNPPCRTGCDRPCFTDNVLIVAQLLLVEDDASIRGALIRALTERGHAVASTSSAMDALQQIHQVPPDLVLLDLGLPDLGGYEALRMMRAISKVPVVVITARDDEAEIVRVLDAGADDYMVKPFGGGQVDARIRAVLRRAEGGEPKRPAPVTVGALCLDAEAHDATLDGLPLDLSPREFDLLLYLVAHAGQLVTKRDLLTHVWQMPYGGADRTVDVHVSWLRRKLGETAQQPRYLHTVRGVGIKLTAPP